MTSCYTYVKVPTGKSIHEQAIGKNKNQILRLYGVPDRKDSDGADGEIFIYEKASINTTTNAGDYSNGLLYGMNYGLGQISSSHSSSHLSSSTSTTIDKSFLNLYFNKNGIVYDYKSNYGYLYRTEKRLNKKTVIGVSTVFGSLLFLAGIVGLLLGISN